MHHCLCIEDVMRVVFDFIDEHEFDPVRAVYVRREHSLRMLASLARTCRTFKDPALDVLWKEMPDLYILLKSHIPRRLLKIKNSVLSFVSEPTLEDWQHLDPYIKRIRIIGTPLPFTKPKRLMFHPSVLQPLADYLRAHGPSTSDQSLIPHLTDVVWDPLWGHGVFQDLLIGPSLRSLKLLGYQAANVLSDSWNTWLRAPTPATLRSLEINGTIYMDESELNSVHSTILTGLRTLHHLDHIYFAIGLLSEEAVAYLTSLPTLTSLGIYFYKIRRPREVDLGLTPREFRFSRLRTLSISIDTWDDDGSLAHFIGQHIDASTLETVTLIFKSHKLDDRLLHQLLPAATTLRELELYIGISCWWQGWWRQTYYSERDPEFHFASYPALLQFTKLRVLRVEDQHHACAANNDSLRAIADAFPELEVLSLCSPSTTRYEARSVPQELLPTLDGLLPIAERCRNLHTLRLPVRSTFGHSSETLLAASRCASMVHTLALWATPLELEPSDTQSEPDKGFPSATPQDVTAFFDKVFPRVDDLRVVLPMDDAYGLNRQDDVRGWSEVLDKLSETETISDGVTRFRVIV